MYVQFMSRFPGVLVATLHENISQMFVSLKEKLRNTKRKQSESVFTKTTNET